MIMNLSKWYFSELVFMELNYKMLLMCDFIV